MIWRYVGYLFCASLTRLFIMLNKEAIELYAASSQKVIDKLEDKTCRCIILGMGYVNTEGELITSWYVGGETQAVHNVTGTLIELVKEKLSQ